MLTETIPNNIFGYDLHQFFCVNKSKFDECIWEVLCKLSQQITLEENVSSFDKRDCEIISSANLCCSRNPEIAARSMEIMSRFIKDKRDITTNASNAYLCVYDSTWKWKYLYKSLSVRIVPSEEYFDALLVRLFQIHPKNIMCCMPQLRRLFGKENVKKIATVVWVQYNHYVQNSNYQAQYNSLELLFNLKVISKEEYDVKLSASMEKEADEMEERKGENTFMFRVRDLYQEAYSHIFPWKKKHQEDCDRLKIKVEKASIEHAKILQIFGASRIYEPSENAKKVGDYILTKTKMKDINTFIEVLLSIPFSTREQVSSKIESNNHNEYWRQFCGGGTSVINCKGDTIGYREQGEADHIDALKELRADRLYLILSTLKRIKKSRAARKLDDWVGLLVATHPLFCSNSTIYLFALGLSHACNLDIVSATHVFVPALERYFREKANYLHGSQTKYQDKIQEESTLNSLLDTLSNDFESNEEYFDIKAFLTNGIDVHLRHDVAHGLTTITEIHRWGLYLTWICVKVFFEDVEKYAQKGQE